VLVDPGVTTAAIRHVLTPATRLLNVKAALVFADAETRRSQGGIHEPLPHTPEARLLNLFAFA
jgi:hypothetical protein